MNMHMGQNVLAETELRCLAAIPTQIISPANNAPIIAIYQDSLLGSYRFTRDVIEFSPRDAMNLLMSFERVNMDALLHKDVITNFDILSQILPPLTLKYKTDLWDNEREKGKDPALSNNILEIRNGQYLRGQLEKKSLGGGARGLIHRICNDFSNRRAADFIDDLQNIITEYMKQSSYSVGVSDLISNQQTSDEIAKILNRRKMEVAELIQKVHMGVFENNTSHTNQVEFETQVNNILNDATKDGDKVSRTSLQQDNRFLMIVNSGSKGSLLNISHMMSCLGQVNVDAKRVAYGFDSRTLPHFSKFDDSPAARGFIENSYINGLSASELFFHAMGGRIGLIDTAVKSVAWETPVFIRVNDNLVYTEIGRWIDSLLDDPNFRDNVVYSPEDRNMESLNIPHNVSIPSMSMKGVMSLKSVTHVCRHDPGDVLYEIATASGRKVIVTASKSLLVWNRQLATFEERFTTDIHVGDLLPVHHKCLDFGNFKNPLLHDDQSYKYSLLEIMEMIVQICKWKQENVIPVDFFQDSRNPPILVRTLLQLYDSGDLDVVVCQSQRDCDFISMAFTSTSRTVMIGEPLTIFLNSASFFQHSKVNDVSFDPIVSMRAIDPTSDEPRFRKMYDITVPSTLNFGLANGLQVRDTSQTGYIQRRLIKGMEDLKVEYDMTVRNNKGKIIEFAYGDDGFDPMKTEGQDFPLLSMSIEDIFMHHDFDDRHLGDVFVKEAASKFRKEADAFKTRCSVQIASMLGFRDELVEKVFRFKDETAVVFPVSFRHLVNMVQGNFSLSANSLVDLTPLRFYELVDQYFAKIQSIRCVPVSRVFQAMYYFFLNPRDLLWTRRYHEKAVVYLLEMILLKYKQAIVHPGEMVGVVAAQSIGEPTTQMTLNSFVYETEILVRDAQGHIKCVQIGDFTKEGIATSPKIEYFENKDTTYAELQDFYEVPSCTEDGRTVWRRIEAVTKHPVINEDGSNTMLKVTTKGNREVIATRVKSFLQLVDGKIQEVNGSDLQVGDYLPVSIQPIYGYYEPIEKTLCPIVPNKIGGSIVMEERNNRFIDTEFDPIVSIDAVNNTTEYAYDLTVEDTRNFNIANGLAQRDTFHLGGVSSKSNVTRGVPRIEEILRLTKNPKNPSLTIHMLPMDESNGEKAKQFATMIEHTKLSELVKTVQICFDPHDEQTTLEEDRAFLDQYYAFSKLFAECNKKTKPRNHDDQSMMAENQGQGQQQEEDPEEEEDTKSKWIVRMEMDTEAMLDKNITMDDIHFALQMSPFGISKELHCVYSDFNNDKLVFRLRVDKDFMAKDKKRRGIPDPLDQSNEIHFLKRFQDKLLSSIVLRGVEGIDKVIPRKLQNMVEKTNGQFAKKDTWVLDTTGTNLMECLALDFIDNTRTFSNDIREIYDVLGIEAARQVIHNELVEVMQFSGAYVNYHHIALLCDRMTCNENMVAIFRTGLFSDDIGPVAKATFEVHTEVLLDAARYGEFDSMRGVSANVMCGQPGYYGTNAFQLVVDMDNLQRLTADLVPDRDAMDIVDEELQRDVLNVDETGKQLEIFVHNDFSGSAMNHHPSSAKSNHVIVDDDYDIGF